MLRPLFIITVFALLATNASSQIPELQKPSVLAWTMADGKSIEASFVSASDDQVTMLVRTTAPVAVFDASSKDRIQTLSDLSPEELLKNQRSPEPFTSSSGKVVSAIFESANGDKVTFLIKKQFLLSTFSDVSQIELRKLIDLGKVPEMELGSVDVPSMELSSEPTAEMDLTAKPEVQLDLTNKAPEAIELDKYKYKGKPLDASVPESNILGPTEAASTAPKPPTQNELEAAFLARQQKRAASSKLINGFLKEFQDLYNQRGDAETADEQWKQKHIDFLSRLEESRHSDREDLIAYSALAVAAAAVERRDQRAVIENLLMLSEFLVLSR